MLRLYSVLATGGFGLCLALDATFNGYTTTAAIFTTAAMILMLFGWFDLRSSIATKSQNDILRENINTLVRLNAKRAAEAASFLHALINIRDGLREGVGREGMIEVIEDALAEHHDPATAAQFCIEWLKALGVPPMVSVAARDGKAV